MRLSVINLLGELVPSLRKGFLFGHPTPTQMPQAVASLLARGYAKTTTGIVGLPVDENARENLKSALEEILQAVKSVPETAEYRKSVEATVKGKLEAIENSDMSDEAIEEKFGRQLEQEIKICQDELRLIPKMVEWAPWEVPEGHKIEMVVERNVATDASAK